MFQLSQLPQLLSIYVLEASKNVFSMPPTYHPNVSVYPFVVFPVSAFIISDFLLLVVSFVAQIAFGFPLEVFGRFTNVFGAISAPSGYFFFF